MDPLTPDGQLSGPLHERWLEVCERWGRRGYDSLSPVEKRWLNVRALIDSFENGGLISYFYNSYAETLQDCLRDLEDLGAVEVKAQVERLCARFPGGVSVDIDERNAVIQSWPDEESTDRFLRDIDARLIPAMADLEDRLARYLARELAR